MASPVATACAAVVVVIGCATLAGWLLGIPVLKAAVPGRVSTKANTAVSLVLAGLALWISTRSRRSRTGDLAAIAASVLPGLVGLLMLLEYAIGLDLGIDRLVFDEPSGSPGTAHPGRMSAITAASFVLASVALLVTRARRAAGLAQALALAWCVLHVFVLLGALYGAEELAAGRSTRTALPTSVAFVALAIGALAASPDSGVTGLVLGDTAGGAMARRLLPVFLLLPIAVGWLRIEGERTERFSSALGVAFVAVTYLVALSALTLWSAQSLRSSDLATKAAHEALRASEERLLLAAEGAKVGMWFWDPPTDRLV